MWASVPARHRLARTLLRDPAETIGKLKKEHIMTILTLHNSLNMYIASVAFGVSLFGNFGEALANRGPVAAIEARKTTENVERYHQVMQVIRTRTPGKSVAQFHAEPQLLDTNAHALVTIRSVSKTGQIERFRCLAIHDIAECLGTPVEIRYLPKDVRVVLQVQLVPRLTPANSMALVAQETRPDKNSM